MTDEQPKNPNKRRIPSAFSLSSLVGASDRSVSDPDGRRAKKQKSISMDDDSARNGNGNGNGSGKSSSFGSIFSGLKGALGFARGSKSAKRGELSFP